MQNYFIAAKELILKQNPRASGIETFVYEPSTIEEEPLGNLYIMGWLKNHRSDMAFIPNLIASVIRRKFYKLEAQEDAKTHLERSVQKANEALKDIAKTSTSVLEDIGLCVVNIAGDKIRFATIGDCVMLLFRDVAVTDMQQKSGKKKAREGFANIVTGDIEERDRFIISTRRIMDLFSDAGIVKLFMLAQENQAEIITKIYQKNSKETPLPDQAAMLLEVKAQKGQGLLSFTKNIRARSNVVAQRTKDAFSPTKTIGRAMQKLNPADAIRGLSRIRVHRNALLLSTGIVLTVVGSFVYVAMSMKFTALANAKAKTAQAEPLVRSDKQNALTLLREANALAFPLLSAWYMRADAEKLLGAVDRLFNKANNIYIGPPVFIATVPTTSLQFTPSSIFDTQDYLYVFDKTPNLFYKIDTSSREGSFTFLDLATTTESNRAFQKDGKLYFVNDAARAAYVFSPADKKLERVAASLKKTLAEPSAQNTRDMPDARYALTPEKSRISKDSKLGTIRDLFLLGAYAQNPLDFTVSHDAKYIYVLAQNNIFALENSQ
ncbi:hypothetical protein A3C91_05015 [Candidatus Azambacteria bacterium RIFCSPHIGHO2_02_FULL_52_12]|uniref:PPM-type phosphatase domain-containing protein n=1 Tax=Candidatus Azambacteria bacterium RIFCSPLOWO2_01_FULL_46_25 TaxID=1797298 RepID=A0A1F5BVW5_9BACT|nr:MAG: hypothetical protein A3C91_05015 [Candidatus Azambacteria bacterium RIFCSPHIGHO2_02_FULL_52_12]OGD34749.1 MAG: hypothetical protein A2988_04625 [Candidatus Azambacteria bacterium RIFCSPLOWO2_01_FULL_46_25]OGD36943.1 MAG: hypothetical protein A2850_00820 [Candidatus Azambacteria bacterium RIFCSPHIGHO2_01_FULL_51_74]